MLSKSSLLYTSGLSISHPPQKLCLRQNAISHINFPENFGSRLQELDLYDNLISHIRGLEAFRELTSLDLSFNKIKHIKNVNHLKKLTDIYFVQNKITKIEGLEGLDKLRNLELAANRIRVDSLAINARSSNGLLTTQSGNRKPRISYITRRAVARQEQNHRAKGLLTNYPCSFLPCPQQR